MLIDTYEGQGNSLADDPDQVLAAREMDSLGVYSAVLIRDAVGYETHCVYCTEEQRAELEAEAEHTLDEYSFLMTGVAKDADGFLTILVFGYEDQEVASRNVPVFEQRLATGVSIASSQPWAEDFTHAEVWNEGKALIARWRTENALIWVRMVNTVDSLLWHK